ncbi:MAG TPA: hypothetical protein VNM67_22530 [Thermoanaerobaculia bacterium]|nr:hypothetical protein [Thermoanaerobaculia bacterium]
MTSHKRTIGYAALMLTLLASGARGQQTTKPPTGLRPQVPEYVNGPAPDFINAVPVIRVYQDSIPWFGENRDKSSILSLGKVLGVDYFIHPLSDLASGIPAGTAVVLITSNGFGNPSATTKQNAPAAQAALIAFVDSGGVLIVDMGDNEGSGGYKAPGSAGTPTLILANPANDATLASAARGPDGVLGTADDHPIVKGPDGLAGTADDLDNNRIDMCCYVAHGNLAQGLTLPPDASVLMTAGFGGPQQPILAEYCFGSGRVILDTMTKEFVAQQPSGTGPSYFLRSLLAYALSEEAKCVLDVAVDIKPGSCPNPFNLQQQGVLPAAVLGAEGYDVEDIDPASIRLQGVAPLRWSLEDVATPFSPFRNKSSCTADCSTAGADGLQDLTLKFDAQQIAAALGFVTDGECRSLKLTGKLFSGQAIEGEDVVRLKKKK